MRFCADMKPKLWGLLLAVVVGVTVLVAGNAAASLVGKQAPEFTNDTWINTEGKTLRLKDLRGKVVLIEFWTYG